jgi:MoxR-like ATPase
MGFVFVDGKLHNVIIDETAPTMETAHDQPQEDPAHGTASDYIKPDIYDQVKKAVLAGMNPVIFGPAGSGKSRLCKELAHDLGLDFFTLSFSGGLRYSQVFGSQTLTDGKTEWTPAPLLNWIQGPCLILLDEIFICDPDITAGLNALLEPCTRSIMTPAGAFQVHSECRFIACSNSNGRQQSRHPTNRRQPT